MSYPQLVCTLALLLFAPLAVRGEDDPIQDKLDKARADYKAATDKHRTDLLDSLQKKEDLARNNGNKQLVDQIKGEREAFESKGELPKIVSTEAYLRGVRAARTVLQAAYNEAIKGYLKAKQDDKATAIEEALKEFEKETEIKGKDPVVKVPREPVVVATWAHEVKMNGKVVKRTTFKLYSNGKINNPEGVNTWQVKGNLIILTWPNKSAPGGAWKDVCNLSADGQAYLGKNQEGATLSGVKISNGDADKKK